MGMDVYGLRPTAPVGEYFRAPFFQWPGIHSLMCELCSDLVDEATLKAMAHNFTYGPGDQATCTKVACRFNNWLEHHVDGREMAERETSK